MPTWTTKQGAPNEGATSTLVLRQPSRNEVILSVLCASLISRAATIVRLCVCRANQYVSACPYQRVLKSFGILKVLPLTEKERKRGEQKNQRYLFTTQWPGLFSPALVHTLGPCLAVMADLLHPPPPLHLPPPRLLAPLSI